MYCNDCKNSYKSQTLHDTLPSPICVFFLSGLGQTAPGEAGEEPIRDITSVSFVVNASPNRYFVKKPEGERCQWNAARGLDGCTMRGAKKPGWNLFRWLIYVNLMGYLPRPHCATSESLNVKSFEMVLFSSKETHLVISEIFKIFHCSNPFAVPVSPRQQELRLASEENDLREMQQKASAKWVLVMSFQFKQKVANGIRG